MTAPLLVAIAVLAVATAGLLGRWALARVEHGLASFDGIHLGP